MKSPILFLAIASFPLVFASVSAEPDLSKLPAASNKKGLTYEKDIKPILTASCIGCHGEEKQKGDLRLDSLEALLKGGENGEIIVSGKSAESPLVIAVSRLDEETAMPPMRKGIGPGGPGGPKGPGAENGPRPGGAPGAGQEGPPTPPTGPDGKPLPRPGGAGRPGGPGGPGGPPKMAKPLTAQQVGIVRAWIDQGAK